MSNLIIGLTGGIGSGKTTIGNLFKELGVPVIDADDESKNVFNDLSIVHAMRERWGETVTTNDRIDRRKLRNMVFDNPNERLFLESLIHPKVRENLLTFAHNSKTPYCIIIVPLMFEKNFNSFVDRVLCIDLEVEKQIERTCLRDAVSREQAEKIIAAQINRDERIKRSDDVLYHCENLEDKRKQVLNLHLMYTEIANGRISG